MDVPIAKAQLGALGKAGDSFSLRKIHILRSMLYGDVGLPSRRFRPVPGALGALVNNALTTGGDDVSNVSPNAIVTVDDDGWKPPESPLDPGLTVALAAGAAGSAALIPGVIGAVLWGMKKKDGAKVAFAVAGILGVLAASSAVVGAEVYSKGKFGL